jgi:ATP diphosphatase
MSDIQKLLEIMATLRDAESGCPWDLAQDFASVAPYTVEEAYEVADAIEREDLAALRDELGDLLFQVVFHARMAEEAGVFDFEAVAKGICDKMIRRHPHVFGSDEERREGAVEGSWENIKATERKQASADGEHSALDGIARALPALKRAQKLGRRASLSGFDWPDQIGVRNKIHEEMAEVEEATLRGDVDQVSAEVGDLLFSVVNLARHLDVDAEQALGCANLRFEQRFRLLEADVAADGQAVNKLDIDKLEAYWQAAKAKLQDRS